MQKNKITEKIKKFGLPDIIMLIFVILLFFVFIYPFVFGTESALAIFTESKQVLLGVVALMVLYFRNIKSFKNVSSGNTEIKKEVSSIKTDITGIKSDLTVVKTKNMELNACFTRFEKITKYAEFMENLSIMIKTKVKRLTSSANPELKKNLRFANKKALNIIMDILKSDFKEVSKIELMQDLKDAESAVIDSINYELLQLNDITAYKKRLQLTQDNIFNSFAVKIIEVKKDYENGNRQTVMENACLEFSEKIVNNAMEIHAEYAKKI